MVPGDARERSAGKGRTGGGFIAALGLVIAAGVGALAWGTDGFRAVTTQGAESVEIERAPRQVPGVALVGQNGDRFSFGDLRGRVVMVEFIYTRCPTFCAVLGEHFERIQNLLSRAGRDLGITMLSISFDRAGDGPDELKQYAEIHDCDPALWRVAVPADAAGLDSLLRTFGVVVIPDGYGGFIHNGGIYLVDRNGRLARVLDPTSPERSIAAAAALARS